MKRTLAILLALMATVSILAACAPTPSDPPDSTDTTPPVTDDPSDTPSDEKPEEPEEDMGMWNKGFIGSANNQAYPEIINEKEKTYVYSDVIKLETKGMKATFTVTSPIKGVYDTYLVSQWREIDGEWSLDPDGTHIDSTSKLVTTTGDDGSVTYSYVATSDGECIRFCYRAGNPDLMDVIYPEITLEQTEEEGTAAPIIASKQWCISDRDRAYLELLEGKTVNFIGDSLFAGNSLGEHLVWPALLGMKYNMSFRNYSISGCTLSACEGGKNPIINRYKSMADNDPDIVIFEGGRNDYNKCAALGTVEDADITTYRGAVAELIRGLREKYPNAVIIGVTFWHASDRTNDVGLSCNVYTDAMKEVCAELGVPYIDATNEEASGIKMTDKNFRLEYSMQAGDVCHLNAEGMRLALKFFEAEIARIYTEATAAADK